MMRYVVNAVVACALAFAGCRGAGKGAPASAYSCDSASADTVARAIECLPVVLDSLAGGMRVIERLTLAWGKEGAAPGDFLDGPRCPDYFQGWIFRGDTLVFLVTGDTARARRELQRVGGSGDFAVEPAGGKLYSEKELNRIMDTIDTTKAYQVMNNSAYSNIDMSSTRIPKQIGRRSVLGIIGILLPHGLKRRHRNIPEFKVIARTLIQVSYAGLYLPATAPRGHIGLPSCKTSPRLSHSPVKTTIPTRR